MTHTVNYYEFKDAPYYGLIMATNTFEALKTYHAIIADIDPETEVLPTQITEDMAASKIERSKSENGCRIGIIEAYKQIKEFKESITQKLNDDADYCGECLLLDGALG